MSRLGGQSEARLQCLRPQYAEYPKLVQAAVSSDCENRSKSVNRHLFHSALCLRHASSTVVAAELRQPGLLTTHY
ncbi:hypothetical protein TNCV_4431821 [Trichonephila clavipes]|nr:hypothetical protein TNCV_4431821 [Trichonephila clavipes]